jgi:hypothetical protein
MIEVSSGSSGAFASDLDDELLEDGSQRNPLPRQSEGADAGEDLWRASQEQEKYLPLKNFRLVQDGLAKHPWTVYPSSLRMCLDGASNTLEALTRCVRPRDA